jgi:hypothetical protein
MKEQALRITIALRLVRARAVTSGLRRVQVISQQTRHPCVMSIRQRVTLLLEKMINYPQVLQRVHQDGSGKWTKYARLHRRALHRLLPLTTYSNGVSPTSTTGIPHFRSFMRPRFWIIFAKSCQEVFASHLSPHQTNSSTLYFAQLCPYPFTIGGK